MKQYFAYGSNMSARRIRYRLGWAPSRVSAKLSDYVLSFNKKSPDGGKANIKSSMGDHVEGILYSLNDLDLDRLDEFEGVHENHYERKNIQVNDLNGHLISAIAYVAIKTGPESRPTREYLNYLLEGEHLLSSEYVSKLEDIATEN
tara:strand:+ start:121 stop:558 length:438 start_codon:yes stop_codon:yes gene_type:complete